VTTLDEISVHIVPCSECSRSRTLGVERSALAVIPAACPGRHEVLGEIIVTVLEGCPRCC
jgi:hypothetical protein